MNQLICLLLGCVYPYLSYSACNHYYQASGPSSTKRPFDICYHSQRDRNGLGSSYRYYCVESVDNEYGANNTVGGFTAFREDFASIDCMGTPTQTRIVNTPYRILCESEKNARCDILRIRQHPVINMTSCTYNESVYSEDIEVIGMCDDNGADSEAVFCNKHSSNDANSYFWSNRYYGGQCDADYLFEATYQFHGCLGDGYTFLQILQCDENSVGETAKVEPFQDGTFVAGFVLLLIAIMAIVCILVWYCCWFRAGFDGSRKRDERIPTMSVRGGHEEDQLHDDGPDESTNMR